MAAYNRMKELKAYDETKTGCRGLAERGITELPRFFHCPPEILYKYPNAPAKLSKSIPIVDLQNVHKSPAFRREIVEKIGKALEEWGFFLLINHGIPESVLAEASAGAKRFHEQDPEIRKKYYTRDVTKKVVYNCGFDLFRAANASWRDAIMIHRHPNGATPEEIPVAFRDIVIEYTKYMEKLGLLLFELISEALRLDSNYLKEMGCADGSYLLANYCAKCPNPEVTLGAPHHTDNDFLTVVLQDEVGGLQILHDKQWVDVPALPGALAVNTGDILQLMSNDKFKSTDHRVRINGDARTSMAFFFSSNEQPNPRLYGPIKEILSEDNPPKYRPVTLKEYTTFYTAKGLNEESALLNYRL